MNHTFILTKPQTLNAKTNKGLLMLAYASVIRLQEYSFFIICETLKDIPNTLKTTEIILIVLTLMCSMY